MKSGLQERVGLTEAGLLLDTLELGDEEPGIPEPVGLLELLAE